MSTRNTRNFKQPVYKELESSDEETESNNKHTTKKLTTTSNNNKKKEGKQKNKNNRGSGSNSDDEYNDHDSDTEYSDVKEKQQQQQKKGSRSRTSSSKNNKKSTTTNGSGGGGTTKQKRTRSTGSGGMGSDGNLVDGASAGAVASVNNNVETLGTSLANLQVDLGLEVSEISGNNTKVTAKDDLANGESKLEILKREYAELTAKNEKDEAEFYLDYEEGKNIRADTQRKLKRIQQLDREKQTRDMILAKAKQQNRAIQIFKGVREKGTTSDLTTEEVETVAANFDIIQEKIISVNEENAVNNMKVYIAILQKGMEMKALRIFNKSRDVGMSSITEEEVAIVAANLDVIDNTIGAASEEDELRWNDRLALYNTQLH